MRLIHGPLLALALLGSLGAPGCGETVEDDADPSKGGALIVAGDPADAGSDGATAPKAKTPTKPVPPESAPSASTRGQKVPAADRLTSAVASYFEGHVGRRIHLHTDKPIYQPGETIWLSTYDLAVRGLDGAAAGSSDATLQLISPKGAAVITQRLPRDGGRASADLVLPEDVQGGEYTLRLTADDGVTEDRGVIVSRYEAPRVKKKLEFVRKAYGPGDEVSATLEIKRPTGEPLANQAVTALIRLDGEDLPRVTLTTNGDGGGLVRFKLPASISRGDALLTVLVEDGGVTESIAKRIPIVLSRIELGFFPEGGTMVQGLPTRLYFEAKNPLGKPADVEGRIVDDRGQAVATFRTYDRGVGRTDFTPAVGRTYSALITKPTGIAEATPLPLAEETGCVLRHFDDLDGQQDAVRVAVRCTQARDVVVAAMVGESLIDAAALQVTPGSPAVAHLTSEDPAVRSRAGVARITVFDGDLAPLAERIVFRQRRSMLDIEVQPDQEAFVPREQVALKVTTRDATGRPVPAELSLAVVDDTVLSFADDKTGHLLSRLLLEDEIPGDVEEPNVYFDLTEEKSALGMDLLMGTRGWRRFAWEPVLTPPRPITMPSSRSVPEDGGFADLEGLEGEGQVALGRDDDDGGGKKGRGRAADRPAPPRGGEPEAAAPPPAVARPAEKQEMADKEAKPDFAAQKAPRAPAAEPVMDQRARREAPIEEAEADAEVGLLGGDAAMDEDWAPNAGARAAGVGRAEAQRQQEQLPYAPVRVFPAPDYAGTHEGARTDFRETVHWAPRVRTDAGGQATVTFYLSDAVTSFRVTSEGIGAGAAGRNETVITSKLPFSMNVKLPLAVSEGDRMELPLTLTNEQNRALPVSLTSSFGEGLRLEKPVALSGPALPANGRESLWHVVTVTGKQGKSEVRFAANAGGLEDAFERTLTVQPLGFPQVAEASATLATTARHTFDLGEAIAGTVTGKLTLYPSPVATLVTGLEAMIQEPGGCFEQTSSSNYPNIMVLRYLEANDAAAPELVTRTQGMLDRGYKKLVGFESGEKGYEWFGRSPAHEALTAYGLLEFADMRSVYGGVDETMVARTAEWLKTRRDGKGGFKRDGAALDSFGRAGPEVTDAYVVYALAQAKMIDGFPAELAVQRAAARDVADPYRLALAAGTLLAVPADRAAGMTACARLAGLQAGDGSFPGADHSITRSGGTNLDIETTALALLALMESGGHGEAVRKGIAWLNDHRGGYGQWGATQATVLALQAMTRYTTESRVTRSSGVVTLHINGQQVGQQSYEAGRRDPLVFEGFGAAMKAGANEVALAHSGGGELPYSFAIDYRSIKPADHAHAAVGIATRLERETVPMGESVRLIATVANRTDGPQPMTLARVGLPGGLTFQNWQLRELREKKVIAFYETREREVVLYLDGLAPGEVRELPLDLVATVAGTYTGPASTGYLYYTNDERTWAPGLRVTITR